MARVSDASEALLRQEIARRFRQVVDRRFHSELAAAQDLGISRQRLRKYLAGKTTPHADVLLASMINWKLQFTYEGVKFRARPPQKVESAVLAPLQLHLFERTQRLRSETLKVSVRKKNATTLRLAVDVELAS